MIRRGGWGPEASEGRAGSSGRRGHAADVDLCRRSLMIAHGKMKPCASIGRSVPGRKSLTKKSTLEIRPHAIRIKSGDRQRGLHRDGVRVADRADDAAATDVVVAGRQGAIDRAPTVMLARVGPVGTLAQLDSAIRATTARQHGDGTECGNHLLEG